MNISDYDAIKVFQQHPERFFKNVLGLSTYDGINTHWPKQIEIVHSVRDNKFTTVKSGHGTGKTYVAASIVLWYLYCFPGSVVVTTAPTARQVKELLWREIGKQWHDYLGGKLINLKLSLDEDWVALGFTARDSSDQERMATRFQGFHAPYLLFILDEAAGIHHAIWTAINGCLTGRHNRLLAIGNPTSPIGDFFDSHRSQIFNKITISCLDHPNVVTGQEIIPGAVTREWVEERKIEWGERSPLYQSRVLANFPEEAIDTLMPLRLLEESVNRNIEPSKTRWVKSIGVDVARFGNDQTVIILQHGPIQLKITIYQGKDTNWTVSMIKKLDSSFMADIIVIDDTGVGGGVTDGLKGYKRNSDNKSPVIRPVNFGESPLGRWFKEVEFENIKAELFWLFKTDLEEGNLKILDEGQMLSHCSSIKYEFTTNNKIKIVSKKAMKAQGLPSPDCADAAVLANYGVKIFTRMSIGGSVAGKGGTINSNLWTQKF